MAPDVLVPVRSIVLEVRPVGTITMLTAFADADRRPVPPTIAVPTSLLCGGADTRAPLPVAEGLHAAIPGSTLVVLPDVGHLSDLDAPEAFNAEVRRGLRTEPSSGSP